MRIEHNIPAINTTRLLGATTRKQSCIAEKLSSGYKINRAADNAAGLSISEKMRAQIRGLNQASRNAQDGISMIETADGALNEVHNIIQRMRELSVQAANGTSTEEDKNMIQSEIGELTKEIDRISNDTEFNNIKLLNGNLAETESSSISLSELLSRKSDGINIIYSDNYQAVQTPTGAATSTDHKYDKIKEILKTQIVPEAVSRIISTFSPAFDYLSSSSIGIGLELGSNASSPVLASVSVSANGAINNLALGYKLYVNTNGLIDDSGNISDENRKKLEATVAHEFVHGMMDEALTCGMLGITESGQTNSSNKFPLWFVEGMAQTAAGGYANFNDFVNHGLGITKDSSTNIISSTVKGSNKLSNCNSNGTAAYGTGYLACMYLGQLASGSSEISEQNISRGLSNILKDLIGGKDLSTVIKEQTNNKYTSVSDFQNKFGDTDSSKFIQDLTIKVDEGNGSLVAGNFNTDDILPDSSLSISLFELNTEKNTVKNLYPSDVKVLSGGGSSVSGSEPVNGYTTGTVTERPGGGGEVTPNPGGGEVPPNPGAGEVNPPVDIPEDNPIVPGNKINLGNIKSIDGIKYDRADKTLTITKSGDYTISGTNNSGIKIIAEDGIDSNITLENANITTSAGEGIKLEGNSTLTLKLKGSNSITSTAAEKAGISVGESATLNIEGDGKLTAKGGQLAAAIGGNMSESAGTINISSGQITATGGISGAGIGGGLQGTGGNINITGGTITAAGGTGAAGIGGGLSGEAGNITIDGESAIVTAKSGGGGAEDIGSGAGVNSGNVSIDNGVVSNGENWEAHGNVTIKTTIRVSGTFTGSDGSTIKIAEGGNISGNGTIKIESGSTVSVESGGKISNGTTIDNKGSIDNRGTIKSTFTPDSVSSIKNYISKIVNTIDRNLKIRADRDLASSMPAPRIKVVCNGVEKTLDSDSSVICDSRGNEISDLSSFIPVEGDRFTYKVTFRLDDSSNDYFDSSSISFSEVKNNYVNIDETTNSNELLNTEISDDGKSITYTYALEAIPASSGGSSSAADNGKINLQIGANSAQSMGVSIDNVSSNALGLDTISVASNDDAENAIKSCDTAIEKVSNTKSRLGAYQNRLEHTIGNLDNSSENLQQSESRIRDLDIAKGMVEYSKYQILSQVEQSILSQANQMSNNVLNLLRA